MPGQREIIRLARTGAGRDRIAAKLDTPPALVVKIARRLGVYFEPVPRKSPGPKAKAK